MFRFVLFCFVFCVVANFLRATFSRGSEQKRKRGGGGRRETDYTQIDRQILKMEERDH